MAEGDYWQETAAMYEQIIQKPKMSQKLLCKPPFRYLHDIYSSTVAVTGYGQGLFEGKELDGKAIAEKEDKINWLVKLISLTELVVGEEIDVKPTKIVAGHEPEKTNFFLQQMFRAATAGIDTTPHVQQILGGGAPEEGDAGAAEEGDSAQQEQEQAAAEQAAAAEEDEARRRKKKEADRKRKEEEKNRVQQEEQERSELERVRLEAQQLQENEQNLEVQRMEDAQRVQQQIMRDNQEAQQQDDDDDEAGAQFAPERAAFKEDGPSGAMVEEARRLMADADDEVVPANDAGEGEGEGTGPKIKMGRIGKKKAKGAVAAGAAAAGASEGYSKKLMPSSGAVNPSSGGGGNFSEADMEFMKKAIQVLCQSTNPLGKSIDYVTDDVDSMSKEYEFWRKEAISCMQQLEEQQKITEEVVHPLQDQLADLEERIKEQTAKVNSMKTSILRNDNTISNLLYSVIQAK